MTPKSEPHVYALQGSRKVYVKGMINEPLKTVVCPECLKPYELTATRKRSRLCSDECYNANRRKKYIANEASREAHKAKVKAYKAANKDKVRVWKQAEKEQRRLVAAQVNPIRKAERDAARARRKEIKQGIENELSRMGRKRKYAARAEELDLFAWAKRQYAKACFAEKMKDEEARKAKIEYTKRWKQNNRDRYNEWAREYFKTGNGRAYKQQPENKIISAIRDRMRFLVGQCVIGSVTAEVRSAIGCSTEFLRQHIESMFHSGMQWSNHGSVWHIDHLIPISYSEKDPEVAMSLNHWTNLHPMLAFDNMSNGSSRDWFAKMRKPTRLITPTA